MKDYQQVVEDRYDKEVIVEEKTLRQKKIDDYALEIALKSLMKIKQEIEANGRQMKDISLLDVGCGNGGILNVWKGFGVPESQLFGMDLSIKRVERSQKALPQATIRQENILDFQFDQQFDVVLVYDVFSHLHTEKQILDGMTQCISHLKERGMFVWFDIDSDDHFAPKEGVDSWGFSTAQFEAMIKEAGLNVQAKESFGKRFFRRYQSVYQVSRFPKWMVKLLEKILPGPPVNQLYICTANKG